MEDTIVICSDDSCDSIQEIEAPKKLPPPVIDLVDDDMTLNVNIVRKRVLVKDLFKNDAIPIEGTHPEHWTMDMVKFYNDDWGDEDDFIVEELQDKMDKSPKLWCIAKKDKFFHENKKKRSHLKCWNCCQFGHPMNQCKERMRPKKCHMCGVEGHFEDKCPNSICLNCGNHIKGYDVCCGKCVNELMKQCSRCSLRGHHFINCTDNWRMFHSTIGQTDVVLPEGNAYKSMKDIWCCNCGKKGHSDVYCHSSKQQAYPETWPFVASYESSFNEELYNHKPEGRISGNLNESIESNGRVERSKNLKSLYRIMQPVKTKRYQYKSDRNLNQLQNNWNAKKKKKKKKKKPKNKMQFLLNAGFIV